MNRLFPVAIAGLTLFVLLAGALLAFQPMRGQLGHMQGGAPHGEPGFDWQSSVQRLHVIASDSRFIGTEAHRKAQQYILEEARKNPGVSAELQTVEECYRAGEPFAIATVTNVVARLPGTSSEHSVLVVAHYDGVPTGPGAADDGTAVTAMLEVLRLMAQGPRPRNDVLFLFTDAEEVGSMGASGFLSQLPSAERARIAVVLNFEARGNHGPSVMFETSPDNGWLVSQYAQATPRPFGNSLTSTVYALMDNDTDFSVFRDAGMSGLNFAYYEGLDAYHTRGEAIANIDPRSIQHQGTQMLSLVQHLAGADLSQPGSSPLIYFDVLGLFMIRYGHWLGWVLALAGGLGMAGLLVWGVRSKRLRLARCGAALGAVLGIVLAVALLAWLLWEAVKALEPRYAQLPGETPPTESYFAGLLIIATAVSWLAVHGLRRALTAAELAVGALLPWTLLAVPLAFLLPGASYFFQWPQLCGLGWLYLLLRAEHGPALPASARWLAPLLLLPPIMAVVPVIHLLSSAFSMAGITIVMGLWTLFMLLLTPLFRYQLGGALAGCAGVALALGCVIYVAAFVQRSFDAAHPSTNSLVYLLDSDEKRAFWVAADPVLDSWTRSILGPGARQESMERYFPGMGWPMYVAEAPVRPLPAPELTVESDQREGTQRQLALRLQPRLDTSMLEVQVPSANLVGVEVAGKHYGRQELQSASGSLLFQFWTPAPTGVHLTLTLEQAPPVTLHVSEVQYTPQSTQSLFPTARPADMSPYPFGGVSDSVRITHTAQL